MEILEEEAEAEGTLVEGVEVRVGETLEAGVAAEILVAEAVVETLVAEVVEDAEVEVVDVEAEVDEVWIFFITCSHYIARNSLLQVESLKAAPTLFWWQQSNDLIISLHESVKPMPQLYWLDGVRQSSMVKSS